MINFQCLNLESGRWPHSKLAKLLNFQQIICWWLISELVCWCLNEMAHIITCGCCGKTWPLVSSCGICIYSFMRLRTYTILGEQLRWCWTICHSYFVFIADICMCVYWWYFEPQFVTNTSIYMSVCVSVFVVEDSELAYSTIVSHNLWQTRPYMSQTRPSLPLAPQLIWAEQYITFNCR